MQLPPQYELLSACRPTAPFRTALFDFDGTLSLLREGWPAVMIDLMVEELKNTPRAETTEALNAFVELFIMRLNGQPTLVQMARLADEVRQRGGHPLEAETYKSEYLQRLMQVVKPRRQALTSGVAVPDEWTVAGARLFLAQLRLQGVHLVLASGTDLEDVRKELDLLELTDFFGAEIHGATPDGSFSKPQLIARLLSAGHGPLIGFGDGIVETAEVKRVGGFAIGVASDFAMPGRINPWKRPQLVSAGADFLIPDFTEAHWLAAFVSGG